MSTRYASFGTGIRRSPKTSVVQPWYRRARMTLVGTTIPATASVPTYGSTAHTKGGWTELVASVAENVSMVWINSAVAASATDTSTLVDIGIGAAGSETVVVPDVAVGAHSIFGFYVPVAIPSGSRIALRIQGTRTSPTTGSVACLFFSSDDYAATPASVDIIGTDTATSAGTAMSGASGSWTQITASTGKDYQNIIVVPSSSSTDIVTFSALFTLGVGAAGSELPIGSSVARYSNTESMSQFNQFTPPMWICGRPVPAGSRLAVRHNISSNPGRYHVCLIGIPYV